MAGVKNFTDLLIWQRARVWSKEIFQRTRHEPFRADRRLVVQINDSSESVMANIAEGFGRGTQGNSSHSSATRSEASTKPNHIYVRHTTGNIWARTTSAICFRKAPRYAR